MTLSTSSLSLVVALCLLCDAASAINQEQNAFMKKLVRRALGGPAQDPYPQDHTSNDLHLAGESNTPAPPPPPVNPLEHRPVSTTVMWPESELPHGTICRYGAVAGPWGDRCPILIAQDNRCVNLGEGTENALGADVHTFDGCRDLAVRARVDVFAYGKRSNKHLCLGLVSQHEDSESIHTCLGEQCCLPGSFGTTQNDQDWDLYKLLAVDPSHADHHDDYLYTVEDDVQNDGEDNSTADQLPINHHNGTSNGTTL